MSLKDILLTQTKQRVQPSLDVALGTVALVDAELSELRFYRLIRRTIRARIVGPAESIEYVSTTSPVEPPSIS